MAFTSTLGHIKGAFHSLLGKRPGESSEGRLDGRPSRRTKITTEDACRPAPSSLSKQSPMTASSTKQFKPFDPATSAQWFGGNDSEEEVLSANPVAVRPIC